MQVKKRAEMLYDIEADWILLSTCNYRCEYCFWDEEQLAAKIRAPGTVEQAIQFFSGTNLTWLFHLTGGEPFIYPNFVDLCQKLTIKHYISINTNASRPNVQEFAETIDPTRVSFINCGLHISERTRRNGMSMFVKNASLLRDKGFRVFISYVMYPNLFDDFEELFEQFLTKGLILIPKMLQGIHQGKSYPTSYDPEQRRKFRDYSLRSEKLFAQQNHPVSMTPTIDLFLDRTFIQHGIPDYRGQLCNAGHSFVRIRENGDIRRCGPADVLGNWAKGVFERRPEPSICQEIECPYFCDKYAKPLMTEI